MFDNIIFIAGNKRRCDDQFSTPMKVRKVMQETDYPVVRVRTMYSMNVIPYYIILF